MAFAIKRSRFLSFIKTLNNNPRSLVNSRSLQTLAYEEIKSNTDNKPYTATAFVLHGLLGSSRNWRSFSRNLLSSLSNSPSSHEQLWVLDSVVGEVDPENTNGEVEKVLLTLKSLPPIPSRMWLVDHMMKLGFSKSLSEWIGTNLKKSGDNQTWAFNLDGAVEMFNSYREKSYWNLLENPPEGLHISIVRAENSDRWAPDVVQQLENLASKSEGKLAVPVLPNSGHWVHVDNPNGLLDIIAPSIKILS
ncbi:hypothetical protein ACHQM5_013791 [Ranunculus cassubicifolius]